MFVSGALAWTSCREDKRPEIKEKRLNPLTILFAESVPIWFRLLVVFVLGAIVGSFLNVCISRLPLEKSLIWPGSRCSHCLQPIRWYDNLPLVSYWVLRGRCRTCGQKFSARYFMVELVTAASLASLYYLEVVSNVHRLDINILGQERCSTGLAVIFFYHAVLLCFLLVATITDVDCHAIPLSLTITGTLVGLAGAVLWAWPWPYTPAEAVRNMAPRKDWWLLPAGNGPEQGLYPWPVWGPLPAWLQPGGNWQTGLATGLAGLLAGTLVLRAVRFLFGLGGGGAYMEPADQEDATAPSWFGSRCLSWFQRVGGKALGLGDADLMMMAGSFLGWQPIVVAFFIGAFPGLIFALIFLAWRLQRKLATRRQARQERCLQQERESQDPDLRSQIENPQANPEQIDLHDDVLFKSGNQQGTAGQVIGIHRDFAKQRLLAIVRFRRKDMASGKTYNDISQVPMDALIRMTRGLPFGPALAIGVVTTWLSWHWIGPSMQTFFFSGLLLSGVALIGCLGMLAAAFVVRLLRPGRP